MHKVVALWRYPLKSARGEVLRVADVDATGLRGDRIWACIDGLDGTVGSAKHPRRWGRLLDVGATLRDEAAEPTLTIHLGGQALRGGSAEADAALSDHVGRPVRLTSAIPPDPRLHRAVPEEAGMVADWMRDTEPGQQMVTAMAGPEPTGRFVDFGAVHIVTTGALWQLGERMGGAEASALRFRPNVVIDAPRDPEPGQMLDLGDVVLRVVLPTPRCVIPGLSQAGLPADRGVLSALARHYRVPVAQLGRAACFGTYAEVIQPGRLDLGQRAQLR